MEYNTLNASAASVGTVNQTVTLIDLRSSPDSSPMKESVSCSD